MPLSHETRLDIIPQMLSKIEEKVDASCAHMHNMDLKQVELSTVLSEMKDSQKHQEERTRELFAYATKLHTILNDSVEAFNKQIQGTVDKFNSGVDTVRRLHEECPAYKKEMASQELGSRVKRVIANALGIATIASIIFGIWSHFTSKPQPPSQPPTQHQDGLHPSPTP